MRTWQGICLSAVLLVSFVGACNAQVTPEDEYRKLIQVDTAIQPLGDHPFGEQVDLSTGTLSFEETDISLRGNGPVLQLSRSLDTTNALSFGFDAQRPFGDWDLDIPRIETATAHQSTVTGWQVQDTNPLSRCTNFGTPPDIPGQTINSVDTWGATQWWYGYHLIVPGEGNQVLMNRAFNNTLSPTIAGQTFGMVTKQNWMIGCGVTADDGGEGFLAVAPDGTRYTFAHLFYRPMPTITKPQGNGPDAEAMANAGGFAPQVIGGGVDALNRRDGLMYVTLVQDRFGNSLTYNYDPATGYLISIVASDGREIDISYVSGSALIQSITARATGIPTRTWTYSYGTTATFAMPTLTSVALPDGSAWSYNLGAFLTDPVNVSTANCYLNQVGSVTPTPVTGTITMPSGLTGSFVESPILHGRSYLNKSCWGGATPIESTYFLIPNAYYQQTITSETLTGAGLPTEVWSYNYSPANQSWNSDSCASTSSCPSTVYTDVKDPEGNATRYTFSNVFDATEGQLKQTDYYSGAVSGTPLRSEVNTYASPTGGPWPAAYGIDQQGRDNSKQVTELAPLSQRVITQEGDTYTWLAESFNAYAQVTKTKRSNSIAGQSVLEETTAYLNDTNFWVLGLPLQVTNVTSGEVESSNTYAANDTLLTRSRFGQPLMSYTFNTAGQLSSFTDGNNHTTSLSNYKRGIPQTINYPDSTSETLVVDDYGQITRINDQAGHGTAYSYDPVGRVTAVNYPGGDEVAWTPQSFTYTFVTSAERGVAANHWRRTSTLGSANTITYFDAMLRPVLSDSDIGTTVQASTLTTYDSKGQKLFTAYPSATALTFTQAPTMAGSTTTYDALGRATQVQQSSELGTLTSSTGYQSGAKQQLTDPKGNVTTSSYQVFDSPSYDAIIQVLAPAGITQTIARDSYGNTRSITQSGPGVTPLTKYLYYDSYYRLCRTAEPESGSEVMHYDAANNLDWSASGLSIAPADATCGYDNQGITASQISRTYDAMNRIKTILPPAQTQSTTYGYDPVGRMTSAVSGISSWSATYNFRGMLTGESLQLTGQNPWAIGYAHDASGSLSLIHYPDGENVGYAPDALGRPTAVGSYATSVSYWPNGQVKQFVYGNGTGYATDQNARQLLSNFSYGPGSTAQLSEDLVYDKNGNITTVTDLASGPRSKSFGYDALNRLTSATAAGLWGTQTYTYDALNNLSTLQTNGQTATYAYDASNKLTGISGAMTASYLYDPRGNVSMKNSTSLTFDQKNQLTNIGTEAFAYDAAGRRVSKVNGGTTTYYFYSQAGQLMYQVGPAALASTNYIYLGSKMIARDVDDAPTVTSPATSNNGGFTVSWTSFAGATSYNLQERVNGGSWTTIQSGSATASAIIGKSNGLYGYQVQACNASICSAWSNITNTTVIFPPAAPATVTVPATSMGSVAVSWSASATATSYTMQHRLGAGGWTTAYSGAGTSAGVTESTTGSYTYQVQACNAGGCSAFKSSAAVAVTLPVTVAPALTVPATNATGSYAVSWSAVTNASTYTLQEQANGGSWVTTQSNGASSQNVTGHVAGTYGYRVQGCNVDGCGPFSATKVISVSIPIAANGQLYSRLTYVSPTASNSTNMGFRLVTANTWQVFYNNTVLNRQAVLASGALPAAAVQVQFTWTNVAPPSGYFDAGGNVSNPAANAVAIGSNPSSLYSTPVFTYSPTFLPRARTYQVKVDFFNATGANISSSTVTVTAEVDVL